MPNGLRISKDHAAEGVFRLWEGGFGARSWSKPARRAYVPGPVGGVLDGFADDPGVGSADGGGPPAFRPRLLGPVRGVGGRVLR